MLISNAVWLLQDLLDDLDRGLFPDERTAIKVAIKALEAEEDIMLKMLELKALNKPIRGELDPLIDKLQSVREEEEDDG